MKYMGSKARHAKELLPIILVNRTEGQWYVEPFVGGANMIDKVDGNRIGADYNEYLAEMWKAVSTGWVPQELVTEDDYQKVKDNKDADKALTSYVGFAMSFGGKWFGGYRRDIAGTKDDLSLKAFNEAEQSRKSYESLLKQQKKLIGVDFRHSSYQDLDIPAKSIIYCDPPYKGTTKYKDSFDHEPFYEWCRQKHKEGHQVFVSEYQMPDDFTCIWSKEVNSSLAKKKGSKKAIEKLFTLKSDDQ
jgi:DNA adenine methylase